MNYDSLSISVEDLRIATTELDTLVKAYDKALTAYKDHVTVVKNSWDDGESGIIDAFKTKYDEAAPKLDELKTALTTLHTTMDGKCTDFANAQTAALNLFQ